MKYIVIIYMLSMISCESPRQEYRREKIEFKVRDGFSDDSFYVITIDSCDYVVYHGTQRGTVIHKANCKNHK